MSSTPDPDQDAAAADLAVTDTGDEVVDTAPDDVTQEETPEEEASQDESPQDEEAGEDAASEHDEAVEDGAASDPQPDDAPVETSADDGVDVVDDAPGQAASEPEVEPEPVSSVDPGSTQEPTTSRERLRSLFGRPSRSQALVGVLLAVLGFAAVTQVRSTELDDSFEGRREEELIEIFNGLTGTSERTRREIARLEQTRRELQVDTSARTAAIEQAEQRLRTLNILAGLVPVTGQGLRITITEQEGRISIDSLLDMVQELRTAGAEAMEFNGEVRLVASSSFDDVNGVIHLDGVPLVSPYVLEVIGESHTLRTGVVFPSGPVVNLREKQGADVAIEVLEAVDIESVRELPRAEFAEPAEGQ